MGFSIMRRLIPNRVSNRYNSIKARLSLDVASERLKGSRFEKLGNFWINLLRDYGEVIKETSNDIKERPKKALFYAWGFWTWLYCVKTNPDERGFRDQFLTASAEIASLPNSVRNQETISHFVFLERCYNEGIIRRLNLGIGSFMWINDYDKAVGLYAAHCKFLEPKYFTFHERIVDFGAFGRWWVMNRSMRDYDINPEEWKEAESR